MAPIKSVAHKYTDPSSFNPAITGSIKYGPNLRRPCTALSAGTIRPPSALYQTPSHALPAHFPCVLPPALPPSGEASESGGEWGGGRRPTVSRKGSRRPRSRTSPVLSTAPPAICTAHEHARELAAPWRRTKCGESDHVHLEPEQLVPARGASGALGVRAGLRMRGTAAARRLTVLTRPLTGPTCQ